MYSPVLMLLWDRGGNLLVQRTGSLDLSHAEFSASSSMTACPLLVYPCG